MGSHIHELIELVGPSSESSNAAVCNIIAWVSETFNHLDWFEVPETRGHLVDGKIAYWQVTSKIETRLETLESEKPAGKEKGKQRVKKRATRIAWVAFSTRTALQRY